jgi:sulfur carrier protein ThiS
MEILVRLSGNLRKYFEGERRLQLEAPVTVSDLLGQLDIEDGEVGVVAINGELAGKHETLQDRDEVQLFPPIGGGKSEQSRG